MPRGDGQKGKRRGRYNRRGNVLELAPETPTTRAAAKPVKAPKPRVKTITIGPPEQPDKQRRVRVELPTFWVTADAAHFERLFVESPLANLSTRENAAKRATELARQLRSLDSAPARTVDEEKVMVAASSQYRKWLEVLKVAEKTTDDTQPL